MNNFIGKIFAFLKLTKSTQNGYKSTNYLTYIIIIFVDIFVLVNIFGGLFNVTRIFNPPAVHFFCQSTINNFENRQNDKEFIAGYLSDIFRKDTVSNYSYSSSLNPNEGVIFWKGINPVCTKYNESVELLKKDNQFVTSQEELNSAKQRISNSSSVISTIKSEYGNSLLEKGVNQDRSLSINTSTASTSKSDIEFREREIQESKSKIEDITNNLVNIPAVRSHINWFNQNSSQISSMNSSFNSYNLWYTTAVLLVQFAFLLPIIGFSLLLYRFASSKGWYSAQIVIWNVFLVSFVPAIIKILEFFQVGYILSFLSGILIAIASGLLFVVSYFYIIIIPLVGFAIIYITQKTIFSKSRLSKNRIARSECVNCGYKLGANDICCVGCGFQNKSQCVNCGVWRNKYSNYCHNCGNHEEGKFL